MISYHRVMKSIIHSAVLNCTVLIIFIIFITSTRWDALLDPLVENWPYLSLSSVFDQYALDLLARMSVGILVFAVIFYQAVDEKRSQIFVLLMFHAAFTAVAWVFLFGFLNEFRSGYVFRQPSDNLGYLYPPAIYTAVIVMVCALACIAKLSCHIPGGSMAVS